ncbi:beta-1,4-glucuronyltransferase 1 isoform X2 [Petromyzon marinus]|nr:beta-1,4-glucuronyltransferase 1 isoform X2 [Petromyzon marinus]XP_032819784.1 beta-1,4-glucuronyltransferase 1 isoform X2 [Petromyzon marinus]XP_032819785.1 beta-1,4-glucuronyltransferase 1 isoform X2 [Petromyzon marinus]
MRFKLRARLRCTPFKILIFLLLVVMLALQLTYLVLLLRMDGRGDGSSPLPLAAAFLGAIVRRSSEPLIVANGSLAGDPQEAANALRAALVAAGGAPALDASSRFAIFSRLLAPEPATDGAGDTWHELSLATHTSVNGLHHLEVLLERWEGPVSVAVFACANDTWLALAAIAAVRGCSKKARDNVAFHLVASANAGFSSAAWGDAVVWADAGKGHRWVAPKVGAGCTEVFAWLGSEAVQGARRNYALDGGVPYPNNLLRNVARAGARSRHVLVVDVDMVPSVNLHRDFLSMLRREDGGGRRDRLIVFVVPSFEIRHSRRVPDTKAELLRLLGALELRPFYDELCRKCQAPTDYARWAALAPAPGLAPAYELEWRDPWEPFYVGPSAAPPFDERFQQYGFNRISQTCELHVAGYRFAVLDNAFLVHRGFKLPGEFHAGKEAEQERNRILFRRFKQELKLRYADSPRRC